MDKPTKGKNDSMQDIADDAATEATDPVEKMFDELRAAGFDVHRFPVGGFSKTAQRWAVEEQAEDEPSWVVSFGGEEGVMLRRSEAFAVVELLQKGIPVFNKFGSICFSERTNIKLESLMKHTSWEVNNAAGEYCKRQRQRAEAVNAAATPASGTVQ